MPEPAIYLHVEESLYIGIILSAILYGLYCGVVYLSIGTIFSNTNLTSRQRTIYVSYAMIQCLLNTIFFLCLPLMGQMMWTANRDKYPGGPVEYYDLQYYRASYVLLGNAAQNLAIFLSDALLIYRCYVILGSKLWIVTLPTLSSIAAFAISTATIPVGLLLNTGKLEAKIFGGIQSTGIALATFTNVMTTAIISFRILSIFYSVRKTLDPHLTRTYTSVVAMLIESAAPCAILGVIYAVISLLPSSSIWGFAVFPVWSMSLALFPQLIILRIVQGNAWTRKTSEELTHTTTTINFAPYDNTAAPNEQSEAY